MLIVNLCQLDLKLVLFGRLSGPIDNDCPFDIVLGSYGRICKLGRVMSPGCMEGIHV
jgi:hypothetical protein